MGGRFAAPGACAAPRHIEKGPPLARGVADVADALLGGVEAVEGAPLVEDVGLRAVEVLRFTITEDAASESDQPTFAVADGKGQTAAKPIVSRSATGISASSSRLRADQPDARAPT